MCTLCTHILMCAFMFISVYTYRKVFEYVCMYVCMFYLPMVKMCVRIRMHIYIYMVLEYGCLYI
jgi:hypothetical protein